MKKIALSILAISLLFSCKKDLDFHKFDEVNINAEFGIPLATIELKMNNLLKEDSNIVYDPDGFIRFILRQDSIANFPVDSFIKMPNLAPINLINKLGMIEIGNVTANSSKTLSEMSDNFTPSNKAALLAANGNLTIFPAITDQNANISSFDLNNSQFTSIVMGKGFLILEFKNYLKVNINQAKINLYNLSPFQSLIGQLTFNNIAPNGSKKDSINVTNTTLSNNLGYNMPTFNTLASSAPILVDLSDSIQLNLGTNNLGAIGGTAIFPSQSLNPEVFRVNIQSDDPSTRIKQIDFENGAVNYSLTSTVKEQLSLKIFLEGAIKNGLPLAPTIITIKNETKTGQIDLSNVLLDMGLDNAQPYNKMTVRIEPSVISSNTLLNFDSADYISSTFSFGTLSFKEINGYLGSKEIPFEPSSQTFDLLSQFENGFPLFDPKMNIISNNSIGVPISVSLEANGTSAKGQTQALNAPTFIMGYPTIAQKGQTINSTKVIDKSNSSITQMLNIAPNQIAFGGKAKINAAGFNGYTDFIRKGSRIVVGYEIEMPLSLKTGNLKIEKTIENVLFKIENDSLKESVFGTDSIEYIDLVLRVDNGMPFELGLNMLFADKDTIVMDTIAAGTLMQSAIPDLNGRTQKNTVSYCTIRIPEEKLLAIRKKNLTKMVIQLNLKTYNNGNEVVKIYSDYISKIGLSAKVKMKYKYSKNK